MYQRHPRTWHILESLRVQYDCSAEYVFKVRIMRIIPQLHSQVTCSDELELEIEEIMRSEISVTEPK